MTLPPKINPADAPPYHDLSEVVFEELCCELHAHEVEIATCDRYGVKGQTQFGIDIIAQRKRNDGVEVGQCKCYKNFTALQIKKASDVFFEHWESHWKERDVRRFILFVACDLSKIDRQTQIEKERKRFEEKGIVYEAWPPRAITHKLSSAPAVVARFIPGEYWFEKIVGMRMPRFGGAEDGPGGTAQRTKLYALMEQQIEALRPRVGVGVARELDDIRDLSRRGQDRDALDRLDALESERTVWTVLDDSTRARAMRLRAGILLRSEGASMEVKRLADQAEHLDAAASLRLKAIIVDREQGPEAALDLLRDARSEELAQIRAVCLLRLGRHAEALACLAPFRDEGPDAAETRRLRGIMRLLTGDRESAETDTRDAIRLAPHERLTRHALAVVLYCQALSPATPLTNLVHWPDPVDWSLVRRDDQAAAKLDEAEVVFGSLLELDLPGSERQEIEGWRLACLANQQTRRSEAEAYCRELLKADAAHPAAVAWALARNLPIKTGATRKALRDLIAARRGEIRHVLALTALFFSAKHHRQAVKLLDQERTRFVAAGAELLWRLWRAQAEAIGTAATKKVGALEPDGHLDVLAASLDPDSAHGDDRLAEIAAANSTRDGDPLVLLDSIERLAHRGRWALVAPHAQALVDAIGTADAVRIAAYALSETGDASGALTFLTDKERAFPGGTLPSDLRRLRIRCRFNMGQIPEAIMEAEEISRGSTGTSDIVDLAQLYLMKGDPRRASQLVRTFKNRAEIPAPEALHLSRQLLHDDPAIARELWRQAVAAGLDDRLVVAAFEVGERLGLGEETAPVVARLTRLATAGEAGVAAMSIEEILASLKERQEQVNFLTGLYRSGSAPIHFISGALGDSLARLYHDELDDRAQDQTWHGRFLLARHGGRRLPDEYPKQASELRLHLDVTAVLLAGHLAILDVVERCFRPLRIPLDLTPALLAMRDAAAPFQPARIQAQRDIVRLSQLGKIVIVEPPPNRAERRPDVTDPDARWLAERAADDAGTVVDFGDPDAVVPLSLAERFSNCRGFLETLRAKAPLSEDLYQQALGSLGTEGQRPTRATPIAVGAPVYFHASTVELFALAGVLDIASERFGIRIERSELESAQAQIAAAERGERLMMWLSALIERIQHGADDGTYIHLPRSRRKHEAAEAYGDHTYLGLFDLLSITPQPGDVVWFDDRTLTSYANVNGAAIVGINEILKGLRIYGALTEDRYCDCLIRLRAAHVRYIPLDDGELIRHLRAAPLEEGAVVETRELGIIRRYFAGCFVQDDILQLPPMPEGAPNKEGEIWFVARSQRASHDGILDAWRDDDATREERSARADWIRDNLAIDRYRLLPAPNREEADRRRLLAAQLAGLVAQAAHLMPPLRSADDSRIREYMTWLDVSILQPRFAADPDLLRTVAEQLRKLLVTDRSSSSEEDGMRYAWQLVVRGVLGAMPEELRAATLDDAHIIEKLGVRVDTLIGVGERQFLETEFWQACALAVATGSASLKTHDGRVQAVLLETTATAPPVLLFEEAGAATLRLADPMYSLLVADPDSGIRVLREHRELLDRSGEELEAAVAEIEEIDDPSKRIAVATKYREASVASYYRLLSSRISERQAIDRDDLRPSSAPAMLRHLRLSDDVGVPFRERLDAAARLIVTEDGLDEAFLRLSGLPVAMPESILSALDRLDVDDSQAAIERWRASSLSPLSRFHLLRAIARVRENHGIAFDTAPLLDEIVADVRQGGSVDAFLAILRRVEIWFGTLPGIGACSAVDRLALIWSHANRLFQIYRTCGAPFDWMIEAFEAGSDDAVSFSRPDWVYSDDVASPKDVGRGQLILHGVWYALGTGSVAELGEERLGNLRTLAAQRVEERSMPVLEFMKDPSLAGNVLNTFLADSRAEMLLELFDGDVAQWYSRSSLETLAETSVEAATAADGKAHDWLCLRAVVRERPPYAGVKGKLEEALLGADLVRLYGEGDGFGLAVLRFAMLQASRSGNPSVIATLGDWLVRIAEDMSRRHPGRAPASVAAYSKQPFRQVFFLLEAAHLLACSEADAAENAARFAALTRRLVEAWPASAPIVRNVMARFAREVPFSVAAPLWPVVLELRAR